MIDSEGEDNLRRITLARPERRNALTTDGLASLRDAIEAAEEPVLALSGAGEAFCAGADLDQVDALDSESAADFAALGQDVARALATYDGVTVAAIDGAVRGGGLELALACDMRVCTPSSTFAATGVTIGLLGAWGGTVRLPEVVGAGVAADLSLTGRVIDAEEAERMGLVSQVRADPMGVAEEIAGHDPAAVRAIAARLRDDGAVSACEARERDAFVRLAGERNS